MNEPLILEEHCNRCNAPIYEKQGRYRYTEFGTICEKCGDETLAERQSGVIL